MADTAEARPAAASAASAAEAEAAEGPGSGGKFRGISADNGSGPSAGAVAAEVDAAATRTNMALGIGTKLLLSIGGFAASLRARRSRRAQARACTAVQWSRRAHTVEARGYNWSLLRLKSAGLTAKRRRFKSLHVVHMLCKTGHMKNISHAVHNTAYS